MLVRRLSQLLTAAILAVAFVAFAGVGGGSVAKAQGRYYDNYQNAYGWRGREALRRRQLRENYLRDERRHEFRDWEAWRRHERLERYRYHDGYGRLPFRRWRY